MPFFWGIFHIILYAEAISYCIKINLEQNHAIPSQNAWDIRIASLFYFGIRMMHTLHNKNYCKWVWLRATMSAIKWASHQDQSTTHPTAPPSLCRVPKPWPCHLFRSHISEGLNHLLFCEVISFCCRDIITWPRYRSHISQPLAWNSAMHSLIGIISQFITTIRCIQDSAMSDMHRNLNTLEDRYTYLHLNYDSFLKDLNKA